MKLSVELLEGVSQQFRAQLPRRKPRAGEPFVRVDRLDPAPLAPRARILPCASGQRRKPSTVTIRSISASGVVLVDNGYWLDGEQFVLCFPKSARGPVGVVCTVSHWKAVSTSLSVVSASFTRLVGPVEVAAAGHAVEKTAGH